MRLLLAPVLGIFFWAFAVTVLANEPIRTTEELVAAAFFKQQVLSAAFT